MEILRNCEGGASVRLIRRFLMSSERDDLRRHGDQHTDGRRFSRHLVFNKQSATVTTSNDSETARAPKLAANQDLHFQRGENHK